MTVAPWVGRTTAALVRLSTRRPVLTVLVALALAGISLAYTFHALGFVTSSLRLLPQHAPYVVLLREYLKDFGQLNDIVVAVEAPSPEDARQYAARLAGQLRQDGLGARVTYHVDPAYFDGRALLYVPLADLTTLRDRLYDYEEFLESYAARPTLDQLLEAINRQIAGAMVVGFLDLGLGGKEAADVRFLQEVLRQMEDRLDGSSRFVSPWAAAFSLGRLDDPDAGYFFSRNRSLLFIFVEQRREEGDFAENRDRIRVIRSAIARLRAEFPRVQAGVTGAPALSNDEMVAALDDGKLASLLAFALTLVLLLVAFRRVVAPVLMVATLAVSLAWSMGVITLTVGHLRVFSVVFISIVVGIGIDYGIYFLFRYDEERELGATVPAALERTALRAGPGILLGALAAAGAFLVLLLTSFQGIREFGLVSGIAILMAFLSMITLFPAALVLVDRRPVTAGRGRDELVATPPRARWLERIVAYRKTILAIAAGASTLALWGATGVDFDYNLLNLQAKGVESVRWEERILTEAGRSGYTAFATASSLPELQRKQEAFARLSSVSKVESLLLLYPDQQAEKTALIRTLAAPLASITLAAPPPASPAAIRAALETLRRRLGLAVDAAEGRADTAKVRAVQAQVDAVLGKLAGTAGPGALGRLQDELHRDFADKLRGFRRNLDPRPVELGEAPPELRQRYVGASGRYLIRIQPAVDIWEQAGAERFITDLRSVEPDVTGPPVTSFEAIRLIRRGYFEGALYAFTLVVAVAAVILRSVRGTLLAVCPLVLGVLWALGLMDVLDLRFNMANVWAVPLIIGIAAEFGLNIYVRFMEARDTGGPALARSTVMGVVLNGLTTMAGFASLMIARHQGIFGLGMLLTIGAGVSLIAALAVLPVLIELFGAPPPGSRPLRSDAPDQKPVSV
jgi:hopanoid biosynthesis associated RND transporter like protein HpnN